MRIVPVEDKDLPSVKKLLKGAGLSEAGVEDQFENFLKLILDGELAAVAGLEIYDHAGLVRSVAVAEEYRHSGLGRGLIRAMINKARSAGIETLYLVTDTAADYFY
ncbi:MAG: GNAT family N-acetyltransferase, partial [Firmicutes bacterium]|nr:GNAT family N-acetyltransferase [Bacillota bacterium]